MLNYLPALVGALVGALTGVIGTFVVQKKILAAQVEWQKCVAEKNIFFQTVQAEWNQDWLNWRASIDRLKPGEQTPPQPEALRDRLKRAAVFKQA